MPINLSSRGNPRPSFRYGSAIRNNVVVSQNVTRYSNNAIDELFAQNEQGVWLDPGDMNISKLNWRRANATLPFSGHLYQLIIRSSATSASKISQVEKFVAS